MKWYKKLFIQFFLHFLGDKPTKRMNTNLILLVDGVNIQNWKKAGPPAGINKFQQGDRCSVGWVKKEPQIKNESPE